MYRIYSHCPWGCLKEKKWHIKILESTLHCTSLASEQYKQYIIKKYLLNALHMAMLFKPTIIGNYSLPKQLKINHFYAKFGQKYILNSMYL